jgi:hypothetical protein
MATKPQEIARKENWIIFTLKGTDSFAAWIILTLRDLKLTNKRSERSELLELENNLRTLRSTVYFIICNIKNLQKFRKEEREKEKA